MSEEFLVSIEDKKRVEKGWGYEIWLWNSDLYCGKILKFNKGKKCSFHMHLIKDEVLHLSVGEIVMKYSFDDNLEKANLAIMKPGDSFHVPVGLRHQMIANKDSIIYEFSTHHEDSDSLRIVAGDVI